MLNFPIRGTGYQLVISIMVINKSVYIKYIIVLGICYDCVYIYGIIYYLY